MNNLYKRVELLTNLAILVAALLVSLAVVKRYIIGGPEGSDAQPGTVEEIPIGTHLDLPGVNWGDNSQTLLVVVSKNCHFCTESAPFYQRLATFPIDHSNVGVVALLPQTTGEAQDYLNNLGVSINDVKQVDLQKLGVKGTPTLILVNNRGEVTERWLGKLSPEKESEVLNRLACNTCGS